MIPFKLWINQARKGPQRYKFIQLDFAFSYFSGIWIFTTAAYVVYSVLKRNVPTIVPTLIFPSFVSGIVWALATCGSFYATDSLGFTAGK